MIYFCYDGVTHKYPIEIGLSKYVIMVIFNYLFSLPICLLNLINGMFHTETTYFIFMGFKYYRNNGVI